MLKNEITLDQAKKLVASGKIVYVVIHKSSIVKIFSYHRESNDFIRSMGNPQPSNVGYQFEAGEHYIQYNITHPKCPRFAQLELGLISQLDLFLDLDK